MGITVSTCTLFLLLLLTLALKLIKNHFQNYCNKITVTLYWSINNSSDCIQKLKDVNATSVYTFDFSILYTNLPLVDIHEKLSELICRMFRNANARYLLVNAYTKKALWSHSDKNGYFSFSLQHLLDTLEFILFNTYIQFGQHLFLQSKGIPMGGNASPLIADLYLSWLEYKYLDKLVKNKEFNLVNYLKYNCRFIDDIVTPNVDNFITIASDIYPKDIPLEQSSNIGSHDTFLDLDISVLDNKFIFKIFHKVDLFNFEVISFPYLESNVPSQICHNTFFSQLVRFANICSNFAGFAERVKLVFNKLLARKYDKELLKRTFQKFVCQ